MAKIGHDEATRDNVLILFDYTKFERAKKQPRNCVLSPFSWNLVNMEISGSKKRKLTCIEEDEEEAKIETFFALVRSMRETRDRWNKNKMSENVKEENRVVSVWKPMFQLEDFMEDQDADDQCRKRKQNRNPTLDGGSTSNDINCANNKEDDAEKGIDLKLSL
ncbi:protein NIM1-INTERACTING [Trifolium repens]|nr:protein NIM1-INTERACTING [Trifolium repens]